MLHFQNFRLAGNKHIIYQSDIDRYSSNNGYQCYEMLKQNGYHGESLNLKRRLSDI